MNKKILKILFVAAFMVFTGCIDNEQERQENEAKAEAVLAAINECVNDESAKHVTDAMKWIQENYFELGLMQENLELVLEEITRDMSLQCILDKTGTTLGRTPAALSGVMRQKTGLVVGFDIEYLEVKRWVKKASNPCGGFTFEIHAGDKSQHTATVSECPMYVDMLEQKLTHIGFTTTRLNGNTIYVQD